MVRKGELIMSKELANTTIPESTKIKDTTADKAFMVVLYVILFCVLVIVVYPLLFVVLASVSDARYVNSATSGHSKTTGSSSAMAILFCIPCAELCWQPLQM